MKYCYEQEMQRRIIQEERANWKHYLSNNVPAYNQSQYVGRGIVFTTYAPTVNITFASINILRDNGCKLPVEVWHFDGELSGNEINRLQEDSQTKVKSLTSYLGSESYQGILKTFSLTKRNYQIKTASIINSGFQEVLYMDSDNVVVEDPTYLFDLQEYKETGALFWPDYFLNTVNPEMYDIFGVEDKHVWEQEAGQLVVDKSKKFKVSNDDNVSYGNALGSVWHALHLSLYMQNKNEFYFKLLLGDKDTFRFGWEATKTPYYMNTHFPGTVGFIAENDFFCGHTIIQYSPNKVERKPLFMHINGLKSQPDVYRKRGSTFKTYKSYTPETTFARQHPIFSLKTLSKRPPRMLICVDLEDARDNIKGDASLLDTDGDIISEDFSESFGNAGLFEDRYFDLVAGVGIDVIRTEVPE